MQPLSEFELARLAGSATTLLIDQIRAIDNRRLTRGAMTALSDGQMTEVREAIRDVLGLAEQ